MSSVTMETVFINLVAVIGYDKALQLMEQLKPKNVEETVAKPDVKKSEEKKRIPRMSPTISGHLKTVFEEEKVELTDKLKKEFINYINNNLTDTEFASKGLIDHMRDFVKSTKPAETTVNVKAEEKPKKEKAKKKDDKVTVVKAEETVTTTTKAPKLSNAAGITQLSIADLQKRQNLATVGAGCPVGTFYDTETGEYITGPAHEDDEWLDEVEFKGKTYMVSNRSGRVYESPEGDGYDIFHGFAGVGNFVGLNIQRKA